MRILKLLTMSALGWVVLGSVGCTGLMTNRIEGLNARRLPEEVLAEPRANKAPLNYSLLRQDPIDDSRYVLDREDTLGIYIEGILGQAEQPPPYLPDPVGNNPPAVGFPIPLDEDGTITLPLLDGPVLLKGMTIKEAREAVTKAYVDQGIINPEGRVRVFVTLYRPRTYQVIVIREDGGGRLGASQSQRISSRDQTQALERGTGFILDMPAYENDVLRALMETGGLPGIDAKPEVMIFRGKFAEAMQKTKNRVEALEKVGVCEIPPPEPDDKNLVVIPIRMAPDEIPEFTQKDIILEEGDVVVVETRERDVFYTGGLIPGSEIPLPRDYDLDVLSAIAVAGGPIGGAVQFGPSGNFGGFGSGASLRGSTIPPSELTIIREAPFNKQIAIKVNTKRALKDPSQRLKIKPGDVLVLDFTPVEVWGNLILNTFPFNTLFNQLIFNQ